MTMPLGQFNPVTEPANQAPAHLYVAEPPAPAPAALITRRGPFRANASRRSTTPPRSANPVLDRGPMTAHDADRCLRVVRAVGGAGLRDRRAA